jgi:hypothetical protein
MSLLMSFKMKSITWHTLSPQHHSCLSRVRQLQRDFAAPNLHPGYRHPAAARFRDLQAILVHKDSRRPC